MSYFLTKHHSLSKECADGKRRNILYYFLNGVKILEQKIPFDFGYSTAYQLRTSISDEYILNGTLYQTRQYRPVIWNEDSHLARKTRLRHVKYPLSKTVLEQFNIPADLKIELNGNRS